MSTSTGAPQPAAGSRPEPLGEEVSSLTDAAQGKQGELPAPDIMNAALRAGWLTQTQWEQAYTVHDQLRADRDTPVPPEHVLLRLRFLTAKQLGLLVGAIRGLAPGSKLGRYEIRGRLGQGGMASVYRAYDTAMEREVALKVAPLEDEAEDRLVREAHAVAKLRHPNIVSVFDAGEEGPVKFVAMELVEGRTLGDVWDGWDLRARVEAVERTARAAAHAHDHGVIHRDLKPRNILVAAGGDVRVADFGLAWLEGGTRVTIPGTIMGTPAYMAPEQVRGEPAERAADIYALGVILYEALTRRLPFVGREPKALYMKVLHRDPIPPRRLRPGLPRDLEVVCLKAMEKPPHRRYATARDLADELARWLAGEPVRTRPPGWPRKALRRVRRNPAAWGAVALCVLLAVGILWMTRGYRDLRLSNESVRALQEADRLLGEWRMERYLPPHNVVPSRRLLRGAVVPLRRAIEGQRQAHPLWAKLGRVYLELGELDLAVDALEQAVRLDPQEGSYHWWLGWANGERARSRGAGSILDPKGAPGFGGGLETERQIRASLNCPRHSGEAWEREWANAYLDLEEGRAGWAQRLQEVGARCERGAEEVWMLLGRAAERRGELETAQEFYDRAASHARSYAPAQVSAALVRAFRGARMDSEGRGEELLREAVANATAAVEIDEELADAHLVRGIARVNLAAREMDRGGDPHELFRAAIDGDFARALQLLPGSDHAWWARGKARVAWSTLEGRRGRDPINLLRAAVEIDFQRALRLEPRFAAAWTARGSARANWAFHAMHRGEDPTDLFRAAVDVDFARAAELDPDSADVLRSRALAFINWGAYRDKIEGDPTQEYRRAIEDLDRAIDLDPGHADAWMYRGMARVNWGLYLQDRGEDPVDLFRAAIEQDYSRAARLNPDSAEAWRRLGSAQTALAIRLAQTPEGGGAADGFARAEESLMRSMSIDPAEPETWLRLGYLRLRGGRPEEAVCDLRRALDLAPGMEATVRPLLKEAQQAASEPEY